MPSVETIYQETIRPLPVGEQVRLAEMILERSSTGSPVTTRRSNGTPVREKRSILEFLESVRSKHATRTAADIDEQIRAERDSWDD